MANVITKLLVELGLKDRGLKSGLDSASGQVKGFGNLINKLGGLIAGAFTVSKIIQFTKEAHRLAGETQGVKEAFDRLDKPGFLDELRVSTRGTVNDLNLMKAAVRSDNFKVPLEKLGSFFDFATKRAAQTGESVDYLVQSLITGIGRKSVLVMDNLGISAIELQEEFHKVGDFGEAAGNIIQRELEKAGDVTTTSVQKTEMLKAAWENLLTTLGGSTGVFDKVKTGLTGIFKYFSVNMKQITDETFTSLKDQFDKSFEGLTEDEAWEKYSEQLDSVEKDLQSFAIAAKIASSPAERKEMMAKVEAYKQYEKWIREVASQVERMEEIRKKTSKPELEQIKTIDTLKKQLEELTIERNGLNISDKNGIEIKNKEIDAITRQIEKLQELGKAQDLKRINLPEIKSRDFSVDEIFGEDIVDKEYENAINSFYENYNKNIQETTDSIMKLNEMTAMSGEIFMNSFNMANEGVKRLKENVLNAARGTLKAYLAESIAGAVKNALTSVPAPFNLILAAGAGAAAGTLFNSIVPSFANEGVVGRPTMAMVGDYPGAKQNPEFMLKQSTLSKLINNGGGQLSARLRGEDIYLSVTRASKRLSDRGTVTKF
jgi:hypothetical protein